MIGAYLIHAAGGYIRRLAENAGLNQFGHRNSNWTLISQAQLVTAGLHKLTITAVTPFLQDFKRTFAVDALN